MILLFPISKFDVMGMVPSRISCRAVRLFSMSTEDVSISLYSFSILVLFAVDFAESMLVLFSSAILSFQFQF